MPLMLTPGRALSIAFAVGSLIFSAACHGPTDALGDDTSDVSSVVEHALEGVDERMIVGDLAGKLALVHVGQPTTVTPLAAPFSLPPGVVRPHDGNFFLVYEQEKSLVRLDWASGTIGGIVPLPIESPVDVEFVDATRGYVSSRREARVALVDLPSGTEVSSIDLSGAAVDDSTVEARRLKIVDHRLFVQLARKDSHERPLQGAVAVIDTETNQLEKVIELEGVDPRSNERISGLDPDLPFVFDAKRNQLLVTALGRRPSNTGLLARIDPDALVILRVERSNTFQGTLALDHSFDGAFIVEHTSTPVTSSHLVAARVQDDGSFERQPRALVDAFDGTDAISMNANGTLLAMANTCILGFCSDGAGVSFVDARNRTVLPKLMADQIGFEPVLVEFVPSRSE